MSAQLRAAQQQIAELQRELAQARQSLEDFTYTVSHDLRAPLRHIGAYLNIIREDLGDGVDAGILAHLRTVGDAAATMSRLMDGLMELSRTGRAELQPSDVDLQALIDEVREKLAGDIGGRSIDWQLAPDLPAVRGDLPLLGQLMQRLLGNAIKFTRDTPLARIAVGWQAMPDGWCELWIQDNGAGFDPRFADRLFKVFQRLHSGRQFEGTGVGLALARLIVERHGGSIRAAGEPDRGCTVSLRLPLASAAAASAAVR